MLLMSNPAQLTVAYLDRLVYIQRYDKKYYVTFRKMYLFELYSDSLIQWKVMKWKVMKEIIFSSPVHHLLVILLPSFNGLR